MKHASFDIEILKSVEGDDWKNQRPLGISCAAIATDKWPDGWRDDGRVWTYVGKPQLERGGLDALVHDLASLAEMGYTIVTWNGAAFDFDILAEESGLYDECAQLALNHVDLMAIVVAMKGHYLSLSKAAEGAGVPNKLKQVTLNDGSIHEAMDGAAAPVLWAAGEYDAVLAYLRQDVETTLAVAKHWQKTMSVEWISNRGFEQGFGIPHDWKGLPTVQELLSWEPRKYLDTSWMSNPPSLDAMMAWTGWENDS